MHCVSDLFLEHSIILSPWNQISLSLTELEVIVHATAKVDRIGAVLEERCNGLTYRLGAAIGPHLLVTRAIAVPAIDPLRPFKHRLMPQLGVWLSTGGNRSKKLRIPLLEVEP